MLLLRARAFSSEWRTHSCRLISVSCRGKLPSNPRPRPEAATIGDGSDVNGLRSTDVKKTRFRQVTMFWGASFDSSVSVRFSHSQSSSSDFKLLFEDNTQIHWHLKIGQLHASKYI